VAGLGAETVSAVALGGEIAFVGLLSDGAEAAGAVDARALFASGATVRTLAVGSRVQFEQMVRAIDAHAIVPEIDRVFAFEDAIPAYHHYATHQPLGKVVIAG
jgi:NADPH:quinone reductase-like Zn-dependent oxidoreductase